MERRLSHMTALPPQLGLCAAVHAALMLFVFPQETTADHGGMVIWWTCISLTYIALTLYLRRPRGLRGVLVIVAAALGLQLGLTLRWGLMPHSYVGWLVLFPAWGYTYYRCVMTLLQGPAPERLLSVFELNAMMLLATAVCSALQVMGYGNMLHLTFGLLLSMLALARLRRGHRRMSTAGAGSGLMLAALGGIGGCAGLFALLATGDANALLTRFTQWALSAWGSVLDSLGRVIYWLLSLMPQLDREVTDKETEELFDYSYISTDEVVQDTDILLALLLAAAAAAVIYLALRLWRSRHLFRIRTLAAPVGQVTRAGRSFGDILREQWARWKALTAYIRRYLRHRGTAEGLLVWLELRMALRRKPRKAGESPRRFLERVAAMTPACEEGLRNLADCLDRHYFGHGAAMSRREVTALRRQLRRALGAIQK